MWFSRGMKQHKPSLDDPRIRKHSEGYQLRGVEIFASGQHRGKRYTPRDLDDMVANFRRSSRLDAKPTLRVPAVLGHEEKQELLDRSDIPAAGWCSEIWREGRKLKADFENVPEKVARLLRSKAYRTVSAEVYDDPPEGVGGSGKMLRRVAFLGGDIPQVKCLDDIPLPEPHSERVSGQPGIRRCSRITRMPDGCYAVFHEVARGAKMPVTQDMVSPAADAGAGDEGAMQDRTALVEQLGDHGVDTSLITDDIPESLLAEFVRILADKESSQEEGLDELDEDMDIDEEPEEEAFSDEDDEDAEAYEEPEEDEAYGDEDAEEYCDDAEEKPVSKMSRRSKYCDDKEDPVNMAKMSEKGLRRLINKAVSQAVSRTTRGEITALKRYTRKELASRKRAAIEAFCESRLKEGKILPSELDESNPASIKARLYRADCVTPVIKHAEKGGKGGKGGKVKPLTELDLQMAEIDRRPAFKFAERFKDPLSSKKGEDAETSKIEEHFEAYSEQFGKVGMTKEKLLAGFKAERSRNVKLTAEEFLRR